MSATSPTPFVRPRAARDALLDDHEAHRPDHAEDQTADRRSRQPPQAVPSLSASTRIAGSRIVTADVFAFTTSADTHAATRTPRPAPRSDPLVDGMLMAA